MRILTAAQMKAAEAAANAAGTSYEQLMENAGTAAAQQIQLLAQQQALPHTALLLCGKGNNAGDAFVIARMLCAAGWQVEMVLLCGDSFSTLARLNLGRLHGNARRSTTENADFTAAVLVDGVFGTGFHGDPPAAVARALRRANAANGLRIALDVPSGMNCDTGQCAASTFRAHHTLTFGAYKPALTLPETRPFTGQVLCLDIGLFNKPT